MNLPYKATATEQSDTYISIATGGSQNIDKNVSVGVSEAGSEFVDKYNSMYLYKATDIRYQMLNSAAYTIPGKSVDLKAGEIYGNMPVKVNTAMLHADSLYALTFKIASVSEPSISIRKTDTVLIFSFKLINDFSDSYQELGRYYKYNVATDTVAVSATRTLKALSYNQVRLIHLANTESVANAAVNGITITINNDKTLGVAPYGTLALTSGGGTYDPVTRVFDLWYNYTVSGVTYQFKGKLTRSGS